MGAISNLGLGTCRTCPGRFDCMLDPAADEHNADMEAWILYVINASKNILTGIHSSIFKFLDNDRKAEDLIIIEKFTCLSELSVSIDREVNNISSSLWPNHNFKVMGKPVKSFRLNISKKFILELSKYARENYPRLSLEIKDADLWEQ